MTWSTLMFGASGLFVTVANVVWARTLPTTTYALVSLWLAIWNSAFRLAPFGANLEVVRNDGLVTSTTIRQVWQTSIGTGVVTGLAVGLTYDMPLAAGVALGVATAAGGIVTYASAALQARRRYIPSLVVMHSLNYITLLVAIGTVVADVVDFGTIAVALTVCALFVLWYSIGALERLRSEPAPGGAVASLRRLWPLLVIAASYEWMMTSDRLVTPLLLSLEDLAHLSVLLALVGPPFKLMEMSVAYTVLPELKAAEGSGRVSKAMWHQALVTTVLSVAASAALLVVIGPLSYLLFGEKFHSPPGLVIAVILAGLARVAQSFTNAAATALVPERNLPMVAHYGVVGSALLVVGAVAGARWGLQGVIYGTMFGSLFRAVAFGMLVRQALLTARISRGAG
jgi:O-antigen/teichoic acid export membrane protein